MAWFKSWGGGLYFSHEPRQPDHEKDWIVKYINIIGYAIVLGLILLCLYALYKTITGPCGGYPAGNSHCNSRESSFKYLESHGGTVTVVGPLVPTAKLPIQNPETEDKK